MAAAACSGGEDEAAAVQAAAPVVQVAAVAPLGSAGRIEASGLIAYKRETPLAFNVPGVVASLTVDEGQSVAAGQRLAALRQTQVAAGSAEAQAALETAERNLARTRTLFEGGWVTQARLDDAELAVQRAQAARDSAGFNQDTSVLNAPAAGIILRRLAEPAQVLGAGTPVLVLGETASGLIVRVGVTAGQAQAIRAGAAAEVRVSGETEPRRGVVSLIGSAADPATGSFPIEIRLMDADGLRSGAVAEAAIAAAEGHTQAALAVPLLALIDARADQGVVYVVGEDVVARRRSIVTAGVAGDFVVVASGLEQGERVVSRGAAFVRDGEAVTVAESAAP
jgi:RND family efflux transporter MFP subunit